MIPAPVTVLAGGVGAARLLAGLVRVVPPEQVTAVVNTGDDMVLHGLHISPDVDTVVYTVAGAIDLDRGWGLAAESWQAMETLERYRGQTWFNLGDRDLGTHLFRTQRLAEGASLTQVTGEVAAAWGLGLTVLPVTEDRLRTMLTVAPEGGEPGGEVAFQDYFVRRRHAVAVEAVRVDGAEASRPAPGVLDALASAATVVVAPSNPIVSIGPVVAVRGVNAVLRARWDDVVAVSPIIAGAALKGPADRMLVELGHEASVVGIARLYAPIVGTLVVDEADAHRAGEVEAAGVRCVVAPTVMVGPPEAAALARVTLEER
jgi:LPPG:FO 2-phospho-L-lactate transferase